MGLRPSRTLLTAVDETGAIGPHDRLGTAGFGALALLSITNLLIVELVLRRRT